MEKQCSSALQIFPPSFQVGLTIASHLSNVCTAIFRQAHKSGSSGLVT